MTHGMRIDLWTRAEAAKYLRVCLSTFERYVVPTVDAYKIGGKWFYKRADLDAWVERQRVVRAPPTAHAGAKRPTPGFLKRTPEAIAMGELLRKRLAMREERERKARAREQKAT